MLRGEPPIDPYADCDYENCCLDCEDKDKEKNMMAEYFQGVLETLYGDKSTHRFSEFELVHCLGELCCYFDIKFPKKPLPSILIADTSSGETND